jgi:hypothetical protein
MSCAAQLKAPEHRRTPKRKREWSREIAATLWSAALLRRFSQMEIVGKTSRYWNRTPHRIQAT